MSRLNNNFLVIRHNYDDHSYIDEKNDTSLTSDGIEIAKEMSDIVAKSILSQEDIKNIVLRSSLKRRAVETSEILIDSLQRYNLPFDFLPDHNLTELFQGKFKNLDELSHQERILMLQAFWEKFDDERVNKQNLDYRFGDSNNDSSLSKYSTYLEYPFGESQKDFAIRIGKAALSICKDLIGNNQSINITHRGATRELHNLTYAINNNLQMSQVPSFEIKGMKYCEITECKFENLQVAKNGLINYIKSLSNG